MQLKTNPKLFYRHHCQVI